MKDISFQIVNKELPDDVGIGTKLEMEVIQMDDKQVVLTLIGMQKRQKICQKGKLDISSLSPEEIKEKLRGSVLKYDDPFGSAIPESDWEACQ